MALLEGILFYFIALQMIFWGLNGFFNWLPPPPSGEVIENFVKACYETRFIMPTVKLLELVAGVLLLIPQTQSLGVILITPIVFGITGLQVLHHPKPLFIISVLIVPFWLLFALHFLF